MSKIKNNPIMKGASGMLGKVVVYREVRGNVIMSNRPKRRKVLTPQQMETKSRFLRAVKYAKKQMADPIAKAGYQRGPGSPFPSAYSSAMGDYLKAPIINTINTSRYGGAIGDEVWINATDNFKVTAVNVSIFNMEGKLIEQGDAVPNSDCIDEFLYTITVTNQVLPGTKILVTVRDRPGNITVAEKIIYT
jgi:hypothetical protein